MDISVRRQLRNHCLSVTLILVEEIYAPDKILFSVRCICNGSLLCGLPGV